MAWHSHSDADINGGLSSAAPVPKPVGQQKMDGDTSAAGNAAKGIGGIGSLIKAISGKGKSSSSGAAGGGSYDSGD